MLSLALLLIFGLEVAGQVNTVSCNSDCMNYLTALTNEKNIVNSAVWDHTGPVTAGQVNTVCGLAAPISCCNCGGIGLGSNEQTVLAAWALTCNTLNSVQDGGATAANCWNSNFQTGCVDYDNLLEGGTCASNSGGGGGGGGGSGASSTTTTSAGNSASTGGSSGGSQSSSTASNAGSSQISGWNEFSLGAVVMTAFSTMLGLSLLW